MKNKCMVCGSFDFRADRALSGRLVCISCGNPYGVRKIGKNKLNKNMMNTKNVFFILLFVCVFILVII